ncbi:MAG: bifunctional folylpolyglutamate synthase/dihydrofolate synthase [Acidimicrobiales bacterium]|nr:bifunctional folylpolyglutamate synthase/dihydrofolate synthase [Acidimicrobiales bacterium]
MKIAEALRWLDSHQNLEGQRAKRHGSPAPSSLPVAGQTETLSLAAMEELMVAVGDPHLSFRSIHITGTNGKGSVARMSDAILRDLGLSVGRYTSPHLERLNERFVWDDREISDDELAEILTLLAPIVATIKKTPSYFELLTAVAFVWFANMGAEVAVVEVGLLGRFDATNVLDADVAVITNIGKDHTDGAAGWQRKVASEKAGIIKPGSHVILGAPMGELKPIFEAEPHRELWSTPEEFGLEDDDLAVGGHLVTVRTPHGQTEPIFLPLYGAYQPHNLVTAVAAVEAFLGRSIDSEVFESLSELAIPGRFEVARRDPTVILEGAHNPDSARVAKYTLDSEFARLGSWVLVIGFLNGKDPREMLEAIGAADFDAVIVCQPNWSRAIPATEVGEIAAKMQLSVEVVPDPNEALGRAMAVTSDEDLILVAGSLYVVGEVRSRARATDV